MVPAWNTAGRIPLITSSQQPQCTPRFHAQQQLASSQLVLRHAVLFRCCTCACLSTHPPHMHPPLVSVLQAGQHHPPCQSETQPCATSPLPQPSTRHTSTTPGGSSAGPESPAGASTQTWPFWPNTSWAAHPLKPRSMLQRRWPVTLISSQTSEQKPPRRSASRMLAAAAGNEAHRVTPPRSFLGVSAFLFGPSVQAERHYLGTQHRTAAHCSVYITAEARAWAVEQSGQRWRLHTSAQQS